MKIEALQIIQFDPEPRDPHWPWAPVGCRITTADGTFGDGEVALAYGSAGHAAAAALRDFGPLVLGMDAFEPEVVWQRLHTSTFWAQGGGPVVTGAMSAIDVALWDIRGKVLGVPVHRLLGGRQRMELRAYAGQLQYGWADRMLPAITPADYAAAAQSAVDEGFTAVKLDPLTYDAEGNPAPWQSTSSWLDPEFLRIAREHVAAVRDVLGPDGEILIDLHSVTDVSSALQLAERLEGFGILALEEPTPPLAQSYKRVKDATTIPVAGGERIYTRWQYAPFFDLRAIDLVQPDIGTCGGLSEAKKIADMAHVYGVGFQAHVCSTGLLTSAAIQLEAAISNFVIHEHNVVNKYEFNSSLTTNTPVPVDGHFEVLDLPGLGDSFDDAAIERSEITTIT